MARRVGCNRSGAGGMNPSPTHGGRFAVNVVGGGVPDAPRRGQDPSLRCKSYMGGNGKAAGRACPAPTGRRGRVADEKGKGGRQPAPFPVDGWQRKARRNPSGLASSASSPDGEPFCAGEARERSLPCQREVPSASEAEGFPACCQKKEQPPGRHPLILRQIPQQSLHILA